MVFQFLKEDNILQNIKVQFNTLVAWMIEYRSIWKKS